MSGIDTLGYIGFTARDIGAWKKFAPEVLGLQIGQELEDGTLVLRADLHQRRVVIHPGDHDDVAYVGWEKTYTTCGTRCILLGLPSRKYPTR